MNCSNYAIDSVRALILLQEILASLEDQSEKLCELQTLGESLTSKLSEEDVQLVETRTRFH